MRSIPRPGFRSMVYLTFVLGLGPQPLAAAVPHLQQANDTVQALRLAPGSESPRMDGVLDDLVWARAPILTGFRQREPSEGAPATEQTEVRLVYDDEALYIGVLALDSEPDRVVARLLQRDRLIASNNFGGIAFTGDDAVAVLLDPFHDHRNGFVFATNPNGAEFDALLTDEGAEFNIDWRGVWEVASARIPEGWSTEFRIPWRTLRYPESAEAPLWGLNVFRIVQRTQEETLWQSWTRDGGGFHRVSQAGHLSGLRDLPRPRLNVEVKPFVLGQTTQLGEGGTSLTTHGTFDAGLDVKTEVRPGLVLDLTVNTDFAQVEVDDVQVNLTRFDLFFPEKRDFFLENSGIFEFGQRGFGEGPPYLMFFSRNIGISEEGEVPIRAGGRLTGRVGQQTLGLLSLSTGSAHDRQSEVFNVARIKRDVGGSNYLGAMVTDRRGDGPSNTVAGIDARFELHPTVIVTGFAAQSFTEGDGGNGLVYQAQLDWTGDTWGGFFEHWALGPEAVAASGFITRTDIRRTQLVGRRTFRPTVLGFRRVEFRLRSFYQTTMDGRFQDWQQGAFITPIWESGGNGMIQLFAAETQVDEGFCLAGVVDVPAGRYQADYWAVEGSTSGARPWILSTNLRGAKSFGGDLLALGGNLTLTPTPSFSFTAGFQRNDVDLPGGSFIADISTFRATWALSTTVTTNVLIQHNSVTDQITSNIRFNFIHRPGSDLFVVFTEGRGVEGDVWEVADRGLAVKLTYLQRF